MQFSDEDKRRLHAFYDPAIEWYGPHDARALRWTEYEGQQERFRVLCEVGVSDTSSVLDVGCGFGDLYQYLTGRYAGITYLGLDINPHMIEVGRKKYPGAAFEAADFGLWSPNPPQPDYSPEAGGYARARQDAQSKQQFDFVLASGAMSFKIEHYRDVYYGYIKKMFETCSVAAAFNMLDARYHIDNDIFAAYWPEEIYAFCRGLAPAVQLRDRYVRQDFTVYLYK